MKKINDLIMVFIILCLLFLNGYGQENKKLAQSGFKFLSVVSDARAAAMADAVTSLQIGSSALFFNPAGMAEMKSFIDLSGSVNQWIADINHYTFSLAMKPAGGTYGVLGFSLQSVDYGNFYGTRVNSGTELGFEDTGIFTLNALAIGMGYAKQLTDRFSVGGQVRWVRQDLGESVVPVITKVDTSETTVTNELKPLIFDFGTQYRTDFRSLVFGISIRNYSKELRYVEEGFQAPLTFTLGVSMNVMDLAEELPLNQKLFACIDASHYRDYPEQLKIGFDYQLMNVLSLRAGYISNNDESGLTFGMGVSQFGFAFDYAYTPYGIFDNVQRMTARFSL
jgi:hypothetical protein